MLAVDHGYFLGPTEKLEDPKKVIAPLLKYCDSLMVDLGFQHNDKIVALDGTPINEDVTYNEIRVQLLLDEIKEVTVDRKNEKVTIPIPIDFDQIVLKAGIPWPRPACVHNLFCPCRGIWSRVSDRPWSRWRRAE